MNRSEDAGSTPGVRERIVSVQVCRGLAAMLIVLAHLHNVETKYFTSRMTGLFQFGMLGVDLFFVISGVVISSVTLGKFESAANAWTFLYHRFARIYPAYWFYTAFLLVVYLAEPGWINATAGHRADVVSSFLLFPPSGHLLVMQGWTLRYELYFYLVIFGLMFLPAQGAPWVLGLWGAVVVAVRAVGVDPASPLMVVLGSPSICEFLAGCVIFHVYRRGRLHPRVGFLLVGAAVAWLAGIVMWSARRHGFDQMWIEHGLWWRAALYGSFSAVFLFGLMELERTKLVRFSRWLADVGDWSYSIYLSHLIVVEFFGRAVQRYGGHGRYGMIVVIALSVPMVLLAGFVSYTWVERPLIRLTRRPLRSVTA